MPISCNCSRCRKARAIELTRPENGGRLIPIVSESAGVKSYAAETVEACECGARRVVIRLKK